MVHREIPEVVSIASASEHDVASEPTARIDDASRSTEYPVDRVTSNLKPAVAVLEGSDPVADLTRAIADASAAGRWDAVSSLAKHLDRILSSQPSTAVVHGARHIRSAG